MSKIIGDTACPQCRANGGDSTGNHLMLFEDGGAYCNRCDYKRSPTTGTEKAQPSPTNSYTRHGMTNLVQEIGSYPFMAIEGRGISADTCEYFGVRSEMSELNGKSVTGILFPIHLKRVRQTPIACFIYEISSCSVINKIP